MTRRVLIIATLATGLLSACGDDSADEQGGEEAAAEVDTSLPGDPEAGAEVYNRVCIACHAADGKGNGGLTGANFVDDKSRLAKGNDELIHSITEGRLDANPPMPPQGQALSQTEIKNALSYVRYTFGGTRE